MLVGSVSVSSCRCLCIVCILWQSSMLRSAFVKLVKDARGDHMEEACSTLLSPDPAEYSGLA